MSFDIISTYRYCSVSNNTYGAIMIILRHYLNSMTVHEQADFAYKCGTTLNYLRKAICKKQVFSPKLVVKFEQNSKGMLHRKDFHPNDYREIWPELK